MSTFIEKLKAQYGYIMASDVEEAIKALGPDFLVVVKKGSGNRDMICLGNLDAYKRHTIAYNDDYVKEVFVSADKYKELMAEQEVNHGN